MIKGLFSFTGLFMDWKLQTTFSFRTSRSLMFYNFGNRKYLCRNFCFNKVACLQPGTLLRKRFSHRCFPVNFVKFLRRSILWNTSELLLLRFEEVITENHIKKFYIRKYLFRDKKNLSIYLFIYLYRHVYIENIETY